MFTFGSKKVETVSSARKEVATLLSRLHEKLRTERPTLAHKKNPFHQDNAPAHTSAVSMAKVHELGFKLSPHPPYSPDLATSNFFSFLNLKICLGGKRFSSDKEVIAVLNEYFKGLETSYFSEGIKKLKARGMKSKEIIIEKKKKFCIKKAFLYIFYLTY